MQKAFGATTNASLETVAIAVASAIFQVLLLINQLAQVHTRRCLERRERRAARAQESQDLIDADRSNPDIQACPPRAALS